MKQRDRLKAALRGASKTLTERQVAELRGYELAAEQAIALCGMINGLRALMGGE